MNLHEFNTAIRHYFTLYPQQKRITREDIIKTFNLHPENDYSDNFLIQNLNLIECLRVISPDVYEYISEDQYAFRDPLAHHVQQDDLYDPTIGHQPSSFLQIHTIPKKPQVSLHILAQTIQSKNKLIFIKGNAIICQQCPHFLIERNRCKYRNIPILPETPSCSFYAIKK